MRKYKCTICGYIYDESAGVPQKGIAPGTKWEDIPDGFSCPICGAPKSVFMLEGEVQSPINVNVDAIENLKELSPGEISAICSSLAKGCEKQRLGAEMEAFTQLADYFKAKATAKKGSALADANSLLADDIAKGFPAANAVAKAHGDRGALRSLVWSEKVSAMMQSLLERYAKEGDAMLENTRLWVCDICGFIYIGDAPTEICPVCKVPNFKIMEIERG